jgi:hypothetical protein
VVPKDELQQAVQLSAEQLHSKHQRSWDSSHIRTEKDIALRFTFHPSFCARLALPYSHRNRHKFELKYRTKRANLADRVGARLLVVVAATMSQARPRSTYSFLLFARRPHTLQSGLLRAHKLVHSRAEPQSVPEPNDLQFVLPAAAKLQLIQTECCDLPSFVSGAIVHWVDLLPSREPRKAWSSTETRWSRWKL